MNFVFPSRSIFPFILTILTLPSSLLTIVAQNMYFHLADSYHLVQVNHIQCHFFARFPHILISQDVLIMYINLSEDKPTRVVSFTVYSGPGWPWNSAHSPQQHYVHSSFNIHAFRWRSPGKMKSRRGMTAARVYYSNCELSLHSSSITCSADVVPIQPHSPRLSI